MSASRPTISVVVPVHDRAALLGAAVGSILAQEGVPGPLEVVVVDDGSRDDPAAALRPFGARVRLVRRPNGGPSAARNTGARACRGRWLAFLDSDDLWMPGKLAAQLRRAEETRARLVYTDRLDFDERGSRLRSEVVELHEGHVFAELLMGNFITLSSVMMRASLFRRVGGFDESLSGAEDWDLWLRCTSRHRVALCAEPLTLYRRHAEQISRDPERMAANHLRVLQRALAGEHGRSLSAAAVRRALARGCFDSAGFARGRARVQAVRLLLRSLSYAPTRLDTYRELLRCMTPRRSAAQPLPVRARASATAR